LDTPGIDCPLLDKFWFICKDVKTASNCLKHCRFCP
jgi:hypothetical protein